VFIVAQTGGAIHRAHGQAVGREFTFTDSPRFADAGRSQIVPATCF